MIVIPARLTASASSCFSVSEKFADLPSMVTSSQRTICSSPCSPTTGAFIDEAAAKKLCGTMEISKGNSAKVEYGEITYSDIADVKKFGLESADKEALNQMQVMMDAQAKDNENQPEL